MVRRGVKLSIINYQLSITNYQTKRNAQNLANLAFSLGTLNNKYPTSGDIGQMDNPVILGKAED